MKKMICIMCPIGCNLEVEQLTKGGELKVTGQTCKRGEVYARMEIINPQRIVTSLFPVKGDGVVSCKTSNTIDKSKIFDVLNAIKAKSANKPVKIGDVLIKNVLNTGVDIVATSNKE